MTDFPPDVEAHYRRLAAQRHWPQETEAAFRASVARYRALDEGAGPRQYYEYMDHEGLVDEGARWLWEAVVVEHETVAVKQIELDSSGAIRRYWWQNMEDDASGLTDQALDPGLTSVSRSTFYALWDRSTIDSFAHGARRWPGAGDAPGH
ncbi:hypothetical protein [Amycolatopsis japonica]